MAMAALEVVQVVRAIEDIETTQKAKQRIPPEMRGVTYFGELDIWQYHAVYDNVLCDRCRVHSRTEFYVGVDLRTWFPYLEIKHENRIDVKVHHHCRCRLTRLKLVEKPEWMLLPFRA